MTPNAPPPQPNVEQTAVNLINTLQARSTTLFHLINSGRKSSYQHAVPEITEMYRLLRQLQGTMDELLGPSSKNRWQGFPNTNSSESGLFPTLLFGLVVGFGIAVFLMNGA